MRSYFGWWDKSVICCLKWCGILYFVLVYRQSAERNQLESSRVRYSFCCYCCSFFFVSFICAYIFFFEKNVGHFFSSILFWCGELTLHKLWKIQTNTYITFQFVHEISLRVWFFSFNNIWSGFGVLIFAHNIRTCSEFDKKGIQHWSIVYVRYTPKHMKFSVLHSDGSSLNTPSDSIAGLFSFYSVSSTHAVAAHWCVRSLQWVL